MTTAIIIPVGSLVMIGLLVVLTLIVLTVNSFRDWLESRATKR